MKHTIAAVVALSTLASLTIAPPTEARTVRADLPCPYGAGGFNPGNPSWTPTSAPSPVAFNSGLSSAAAPVSVGLVANLTAAIPNDEVGLAITGATQYDQFAKPIPDVSNCSTSGFNPTGPATQVMFYTLAGGSVLDSGATLANGDMEVEFNYDSSSGSPNGPIVTGATGKASFVLNGVTYTSTGLTLPFNTANDFLFSSTGALLGSLSQNQSTGLAILTAGLPGGWSSSSGGGGTVSAPEIDPASGVAGLTLLLGGLAVLRGRRVLATIAVA